MSTVKDFCPSMADHIMAGLKETGIVLNTLQAAMQTPFGAGLVNDANPSFLALKVFLETLNEKNFSTSTKCEQIWDNITRIDTGYAAQFQAIKDGIDEYCRMIDELAKLIHPETLNSSLGLALSSDVFSKKLGNMESKLSSIDDKIWLAQLEYEYLRLAREYSTESSDIRSVLGNLNAAGYSIEEKIVLLQSIKSKADNDFFLQFKSSPINYSDIFSTNSTSLSDLMMMCMVSHLEIMSRSGAADINEAIYASFGFYDFERLDDIYTNRPANGMHSTYLVSKKHIIDESKTLIYNDRFAPFALDTYAVANGSVAALTVMRLMLNDSYFTEQELADTQAYMDKIQDYQTRFPNFPVIVGNDKYGAPQIYLGGDQEWFKIDENLAATYGACGSVAAANILASMAMSNGDVAQCLGYPVWNTSGAATMGEYYQFMNDVYGTVKPLETPLESIPSLGITNTSYFKRKVITYAANHGFTIEANDYDMFINGPYDLAGIEAAVNSGRPVAFLNMWTTLMLYDPKRNDPERDEPGKDDSQTYSRHWVDVVDVDGNKLVVSSWGKEYHIEYSELQDAWNNNPLQSWNSMIDFTLVSVP